MINKSSNESKYNTLFLFVSLDVSDVGETSKNSGPSFSQTPPASPTPPHLSTDSGQTENKTALLSGAYGSTERGSVLLSLKC